MFPTRRSSAASASRGIPQHPADGTNHPVVGAGSEPEPQSHEQAARKERERVEDLSERRRVQVGPLRVGRHRYIAGCDQTAQYVAESQPHEPRSRKYAWNMVRHTTAAHAITRIRSRQGCIKKGGPGSVPTRPRLRRVAGLTGAGSPTDPATSVTAQGGAGSARRQRRSRQNEPTSAPGPRPACSWGWATGTAAAGAHRAHLPRAVPLSGATTDGARVRLPSENSGRARTFKGQRPAEVPEEVTRGTRQAAGRPHLRPPGPVPGRPGLGATVQRPEGADIAAGAAGIAYGPTDRCPAQRPGPCRRRARRGPLRPPRPARSIPPCARRLPRGGQLSEVGVRTNGSGRTAPTTGS